MLLVSSRSIKRPIDRVVDLELFSGCNRWFLVGLKSDELRIYWTVWHDMRLLFLDLLEVVMNVDVEPLFALLELVWTDDHAEILLLDWIKLGSGKLYIH